jgi:enoyl-CoA hydratase/carnithine racemase
VNALSPLLLKALQEQFQILKNPKESPYKALILVSRFPRVFSAGLDINYLLQKENESSEELYKRLKAYMGSFQNVVQDLLELDIPTATLVSGACPAGGTVLSLCTDFRLGLDIPPEELLTGKNKSTFLMGLTEVAVGMTPPSWVHALAKDALIPRSVHPCLELGKAIKDPKECLELGFLHQVVYKEEKAWQVLELQLKDYLKQPSLARRNTKRRNRSGVLKEFSSEALEEVLESVTGQEFQATAKTILEQLQSQKKK